MKVFRPHLDFGDNTIGTLIPKNEAAVGFF
jgi:hypothetical protein